MKKRRLSSNGSESQEQPRRSAIVEPKTSRANIFGDVPDYDPTARSMLPQTYLCLFVWCKACHHQGAADLQAIIDAGKGDRPLKDLKFRCAKCGSRLTDAVVMGKGAIGVQPWRHEAG